MSNNLLPITFNCNRLAPELPIDWDNYVDKFGQSLSMTIEERNDSNYRLFKDSSGRIKHSIRNDRAVIETALGTTVSAKRILHLDGDTHNDFLSSLMVMGHPHPSKVSGLLKFVKDPSVMYCPLVGSFIILPESVRPQSDLIKGVIAKNILAKHNLPYSDADFNSIIVQEALTLLNYMKIRINGIFHEVMELPVIHKYETSTILGHNASTQFQVKDINWLLVHGSFSDEMAVTPIDGDYRRTSIDNLKLVPRDTPVMPLKGEHRYWFARNGLLYPRVNFLTSRQSLIQSTVIDSRHSLIHCTPVVSKALAGNSGAPLARLHTDYTMSGEPSSWFLGFPSHIGNTPYMPGIIRRFDRDTVATRAASKEADVYKRIALWALGCYTYLFDHTVNTSYLPSADRSGRIPLLDPPFINDLAIWSQLAPLSLKLHGESVRDLFKRLAAEQVKLEAIGEHAMFVTESGVVINSRFSRISRVLQPYSASFFLKYFKRKGTTRGNYRSKYEMILAEPDDHLFAPSIGEVMLMHMDMYFVLYQLYQREYHLALDKAGIYGTDENTLGFFGKQDMINHLLGGCNESDSVGCNESNTVGCDLTPDQPEDLDEASNQQHSRDYDDSLIHAYGYLDIQMDKRVVPKLFKTSAPAVRVEAKRCRKYNALVDKLFDETKLAIKTKSRLYRQALEIADFETEQILARNRCAKVVR